MRRPAKGNLLLTQHAGRACERGKNPPRPMTMQAREKKPAHPILIPALPCQTCFEIL